MYLHFFLKKSSSNRFLLNLPYLLVSGYKTTRLIIMTKKKYYTTNNWKIAMSSMVLASYGNNEVEPLTSYERM